MMDPCESWFLNYYPSSNLFLSFSNWHDQVERGKQVYYCFDDAELRKIQSSFPQNASYNMQRFKGKIY